MSETTYTQSDFENPDPNGPLNLLADADGFVRLRAEEYTRLIATARASSAPRESDSRATPASELDAAGLHWIPAEECCRVPFEDRAQIICLRDEIVALVRAAALRASEGAPRLAELEDCPKVEHDGALAEMSIGLRDQLCINWWKDDKSVTVEIFPDGRVISAPRASEGAGDETLDNFDTPVIRHDATGTYFTTPGEDGATFRTDVIVPPDVAREILSRASEGARGGDVQAEWGLLRKAVGDVLEWCFNDELPPRRVAARLEAAINAPALVDFATHRAAASGGARDAGTVTDAERLDWLEAQIASDVGVNLYERTDPPGVGLTCMAVDISSETLRDAIDAARSRALSAGQRRSVEASE